MSANSSARQLAVCGSITRDTSLTGDLDWGLPRPPPRRSITRDTSGPPQDYEVRDEGPAQPALRRFGDSNLAISVERVFTRRGGAMSSA
jgi:hypothetical protein